MFSGSVTTSHIREFQVPSATPHGQRISVFKPGPDHSYVEHVSDFVVVRRKGFVSLPTLGGRGTGILVTPSDLGSEKRTGETGGERPGD